MRAVVVAHNLVEAGGLSVGRNVTAALPRLFPEVEMLLIVPRGLGYDLHKNGSNATVIEIPRYRLLGRFLFEKNHLPRMVRDFGPDVIFCLGNIGLHHPPCQQAILFHQGQLVYTTERSYKTVPLRERVKFAAIRYWLRTCLRRTSLIFCQTAVMRSRFAQAFNYPIEQIKVMPNAVSELAKVSSTAQSTPDVFKSADKFHLLFLARYYGYKNFQILLDIFRNFGGQLDNVRVIITIDPNDPYARRFLEKVRSQGLQERIINVGPLKQESLAAYFKNADALFFPTVLESFSGTYLEAMHFGLPILTSDLDFAHGICGNAALYFDPWNAAEVAGRIVEMRENAALRVELVQKGRERLGGFYRGWDEIVREAFTAVMGLAKNRSSGDQP